MNLNSSRLLTCKESGLCHLHLKPAGFCAGQPLRLVDLIGLGFILYHGRSISVSNLVQGHISFILELGP